ncbi:S-type anion channel SLAH2 [Gracilariopsis chorda]|uniref:S-type anion channel SLAH2 n=1 Tax=Gracilariopsis chorda TaxID=448386 RepID=A0A2V3IGP5_9FLOR|nr:S-type anion channel SLAH2 [Gracilariopsis chorda]|eukprot:PXF41193.1 S-type anion channel SLAH2 [Gracilariopsis chorda]
MSAHAAAADVREHRPERAPPAQWRLRVAQFDISHNAIPLAFYAFTATLATATRVGFPRTVVDVAFYISFAVLVLTSSLTVLRVIIHPAAFLQDFSNARLQNFFYLPSIVGALVLITLPSPFRLWIPMAVSFYTLFAYQFLLSLYLYGNWLHALSLPETIYPLAFMQTVGYFLLSIVASMLVMPQLAFFLLTAALLFWLLIFTTLFQHSPTTLKAANESPSPIFFLFLAPPAQATIAALFLNATRIFSNTDPPSQSFLPGGPLPWNMGAELAHYVNLFLYALMIRMLPLWISRPFSVVWWAYVFPVAGASAAIILRFEKTRTTFWKVMSVASATVSGLAIVIVTFFTLRAIWKGNFPKNKANEMVYREYWKRRDVFSRMKLPIMPHAVVDNV